MMLLKMEPGVETSLPLTAYYGITLMSLRVGRSGVRSCILEICGDKVAFMPGKPGDESILYVNGDARQQPTFSLLPDIECKLLLELAEDHVVTGKGEIFLEHYLSYSVPVIQN